MIYIKTKHLTDKIVEIVDTTNDASTYLAWTNCRCFSGETDHEAVESIEAQGFQVYVQPLSIERIGSADDRGLEGSDEYFLATYEDDPSPEVVKYHFDNLYRRDCDYPGGYFCHGVEVIQRPFSPWQYVVVVPHRYDV